MSLLRHLKAGTGAKRIGLLFSGAQVDFILKDRVGDIDDLMTGDENFSDGCGLISKWLWCVPRVSRLARSLVADMYIMISL